MDGKRPETTGGSQPIGSRSMNREHTHSLPKGCEDFGRGNGLGESSKGLEGEIPTLDWKLLSSLYLPGENASYSLHNGNGEFLEVTGGYELVWNRNRDDFRNCRIHKLIESSVGFSEWFLGMESGSESSIYSATVISNKTRSVTIALKRVSLFIGSHPSQSRILLKAVPQNTNPNRIQYESLYSKYTTDGSYVDSNDEWDMCLGFSKNELVDSSLFELVHKEDQQVLKDILRSVQEAEIPKARLIRFLTSKGLQKLLLIDCVYSDGYFEISAQDITLDTISPRSSLQRISAILDNTSIAIIEASDPSYYFSQVNSAFERLTGYRGDENTCLFDLFGRKTNAESSSKITTSIQEKVEGSVDILMYRKNGDRFWGSTRTYSLIDQFGKTHYTAITIEDVTREIETQKSAIQEENLRALGQMASGIAHDFNNLLAPILGFSELLLNMPAGGRDDEKLVSFLEKIKIAAQDGAAVVGRLREFYSTQDSCEELNKNIDPKALAQQVKDLTQHRWKSQAEARGANIEFLSIVQSTKFIRGNEAELRQALSNLVINAVDAIDGDGSITLSIFDANDDICIKIIDTGRGMPEKIRTKCLDPFYTTKGKFGTGLGLSIVAGVVKRHGGNIDIESEEGHGSTITIFFPAVDVEVLESTLKPSLNSSNSLHIMLVDDEAILLDVLSELLCSGGHNVEKFKSGKAALAAFKTNHYDLVITDRAMPNMSGDQLASEIKSIKPQTPVIMATGFGDIIDETEEPLDNVDLILAKPIPLDLLNQKLSELTSELN